LTTYRYRKNAAPGAPGPGSGERWDGADVKVCVANKGELSDGPWSLVGSDDGLYQPSTDIYSQFPLPQYPAGDTPVGAGQCVRGWIIFNVPRKASITELQYSV